MTIKSIKNLKNPFEGFGQWKEAIIENKGKEYKVTFKQFEECSEFGINEGRISKLTINCGKEKLANYDRGWDIEPADEDTKAVLEVILDNEG